MKAINNFETTTTTKHDEDGGYFTAVTVVAARRPTPHAAGLQNKNPGYTPRHTVTFGSVRNIPVLHVGYSC